MEDVFPIENGDIPASYVGLPEGIKEYRKVPDDFFFVLMMIFYGFYPSLKLTVRT